MTKHHCRVCGSSLLERLYAPAKQPLAALNLPKSKEKALEAPTYELDFHICLSCSHVYNIAFDYYKIPYEEDSNLMYNSGNDWQLHILDVAKLASSYGLKGKCIVDIGCGDGGFLEALKTIEPDARYIGFEPGIEAQTAKDKGLEIKKDYFLAERDMKHYKPDIIICRHVIEHLSHPKEFVEHISYHASLCEITPIFIAEVPNIQNALNQFRVADYLYEHVSNFTALSFRSLFELSGFDILEFSAMYQEEVVVTAAQVSKNIAIHKSAKHIYNSLLSQKQNVHTTLQALVDNKKTIALWGATGKGASFINSFELSCDKYPIVVDSDERKCGRYVPGTGQLITHSSTLVDKPCDIILITTNWRAKDIAAEIQRRGISYEKILVVENARVKEV
ncbi:hypothetical protein M947_07925 [Sulfurimonas hongkongensis]|uniref:C-methyltransferase domain-containing protein n=1 Tax=Sulfurimonas hongkongensis TaxID=1172190 RepID=T0JDK3_9BACT|nr:class I SAM-dependent methyltransferase [Sulfurimonas hongkongensis]EQB39080.1 hypothetical protein M947_07925 [Sulfurimonas hongkongensis]